MAQISLQWSFRGEMVQAREQIRSARVSAGEVDSVVSAVLRSVFKLLLFKVKNILCSVLPKTFSISILESFSFISSVCVCVYIFILFSLLAIL